MLTTLSSAAHVMYVPPYPITSLVFLLERVRRVFPVHIFRSLNASELVRLLPVVSDLNTLELPTKSQSSNPPPNLHKPLPLGTRQ